MALNLPLASADGLPEGLAKFIQQQDGKTVLSLPDGWAIDDVAGLRQKNQELLSETRKLKERTAQLGDLDPAAAKAALEELAQLKAQPQGGGQKALEEARKQIEAQYQKQLGELQGKVQDLTRREQSMLLAQAETAALRESKHKPLPGLEYLLRETARVVDGQVVVVDPKTGEPRYTTRPGGSGWMTLAERIEEIANDERYGHLFEGTGRASAGMTGRQGGAAVENPWARATFNITKQLQLKAQNPALAAQLEAQAQAQK